MTTAPRDGARTRHALLGAVALCLFVAAVAVTWVFLQRGFEGGVPVRAVFSAPGVGQQLPVGGDVKVRGVLVGTIRDFEVNEDGTATVGMRLREDVRLPVTTRAEVRSKTIFGQKWVELVPPEDDAGAEVLRAGSVIADPQTTEPLELERSLQLGHELLSAIPLEDLATITRTLADGFSGQEPDARTAIERGLVALRAVNSRSDELDEALGQLGEFSRWLDDNATDLVSFMSALDAANRALVGAAPEFRSSMDSVPTFLNELASFQERTESDLGRLVQEGATMAEIVAAQSQDLIDIVVNLRAFTTVWNSGLRQPCAGVFEQGLTCWQVYQMPGLESRGLYTRASSPVLNRLSAEIGRGMTPELAALLLAPVQEHLPELLGEGGR